MPCRQSKAKRFRFSTLVNSSEGTVKKEKDFKRQKTLQMMASATGKKQASGPLNLLNVIKSNLMPNCKTIIFRQVQIMFQIKLNSCKSSRVNGGKQSAAEKPIEVLSALSRERPSSISRVSDCAYVCCTPGRHLFQFGHD